MSEPVTVMSAPAQPPMSLIARVIGVFTSPRATYADIAARPTVLGGLSLCMLIIIVMTCGLAMTTRGKDMALEQIDRSMQAVERVTGRPIPDEQYDLMEQGVREQRVPVGQLMGEVVGIPIVFAIEAGILFVVFTSIMGGDSRFKQVFAVVVFASLIGAAQTIFSTPIMYAKRSMASPTSLGVFLPFLDPNSLIGTFLGWIDIFRLWWIVSLSIGLAVLYRKRTGPIAITLIVVYGVFALAAAAIYSAFSSGA
jgi:hypothetical protein